MQGILFLKHSVHSSFLHSSVNPTHSFKTEAVVNVSASGMAQMVSHGNQTWDQALQYENNDTVQLAF